MYHHIAMALSLLLSATATAEAKIWRDPTTLHLNQIDQSLGKGGPEVKALWSVMTGDVGLMMGGHGVGYLSETFYLGGAGYGGTVTTRTGAMSGGLGYGGMVTGIEGKFTPGLAYDVSLLVGGMGAGVSGTAGGSFVMEPKFSLSSLFGGGARGTLSLGYLLAPSLNSLSGWTLGLRLDFKTLTMSIPIDD